MSNYPGVLSAERGHEAMADKLKLPASEAEEAQWWYDHREEVTKAFEDAAARGELLTGSAAKLGRPARNWRNPGHDNSARPPGHLPGACARRQACGLLADLPQAAVHEALAADRKSVV